MYVLEGAGTLRMDGEEIEISKRDYITFPAGRGAHEIINSSDRTLRYICFSTMIEPDTMIYPDSGKVGIFVGSAPGGSKEKRTLNKYLRDGTEIDYWDGEE
ncbi:MAG: cupin domain-containing protein [Ignavibacteriales bacterium]